MPPATGNIQHRQATRALAELSQAPNSCHIVFRFKTVPKAQGVSVLKTGTPPLQLVQYFYEVNESSHMFTEV